ncbi:MAG: hypothetical protein KF744_10740 [Taibaiella sp.]|nr:hypothetical protein [Taibaiella sp.]
MKKSWLLYIAALWSLFVIANSVRYVVFHRVPAWPTTINYYTVLLAAYCVYAAILVYLVAGRRLQQYAADASSIYYFCISAGVAIFTLMMAGSAETALRIENYPPWEYGPSSYHMTRAKVLGVILVTILFFALSRRKLLVFYSIAMAIVALIALEGYHSLAHVVD